MSNTRERNLGKCCLQGVPPWLHAVVLLRDLGSYRWKMRPLPTQTCGGLAARPKTKRAFQKNCLYQKMAKRERARRRKDTTASAIDRAVACLSKGNLG